MTSALSVCSLLDVKALLLLIAVGCAADPADAPRPIGVRWTCYTHATCDGARLDVEHDLCLRPTREDVVVPGDAAAGDWAQVWRAACVVAQGDPTAVSVESCPGTYGCDVTCRSEFAACP